VPKKAISLNRYRDHPRGVPVNLSPENRPDAMLHVTACGTEGGKIMISANHGQGVGHFIKVKEKANEPGMISLQRRPDWRI